MLTIIPYQSRWRDEFLTLGRLLRESLGRLALRIDHIGSTAVPGLAAKDIIDIQVTVASLDSEVQKGLERAGFVQLIGISRDHRPPGSVGPEINWFKWLFKSAYWQRKANIHVRVAGQANQRYPLLFRDYLRAHCHRPSLCRAKTAPGREPGKPADLPGRQGSGSRPDLFCCRRLGCCHVLATWNVRYIEETNV